MIDGPEGRVVAADLDWPQVEVVEHKPVAKWNLPRE